MKRDFTIKIFWCAVCLFLFGAVVVTQAAAQYSGGMATSAPPQREQTSSAPVVGSQPLYDNTPSKTRNYLQESLTDLKKTAKGIVEDNKSMTERIKRIDERIPQLKEELRRVKEDRELLLGEKEKVRDILRFVSQETVGAKQSIKGVKIRVAEIDGRYDGVERLMAQKREEQQDLKEEVVKLRKEIKHLKNQLQREKSLPKTKEDDQSTLINSMVENSLARINSKNKEKDDLEQQYLQNLSVFDSLQRQKQILHQDLAGVDQTLSAMTDEEKKFFDEQKNIQRQKEDQISQIDKEIGELTGYREALLKVIEESIQAHNMVTSEFNSERKDIVNTIESLNRENEQLLQQEQLLQESLQNTQDLLSKIHETDAVRMQVDNFRKRVDRLKTDQTQLKGNISQRENDQKVNKTRIRNLENDIQKLNKELKVSKGTTEKVLQAQEQHFNGLIRKSQQVIKEKNRSFGNIERESVAPRRELEELRKEQKSLQQDLSFIKNEIQSAQDEATKIDDQAMMMDKKERQSLAYLISEVEKLKDYGARLEAMLIKVHQKIKDREVDQKSDYKKDRQMKTHVAVLQEENQHLQEQVSLLMNMVDSLGQKGSK